MVINNNLRYETTIIYIDMKFVGTPIFELESLHTSQSTLQKCCIFQHQITILRESKILYLHAVTKRNLYIQSKKKN